VKSQLVKQSGELMEKEREIEREQQINRVRDRALDRNGIDMGQKWPLYILNTCVFLVMQISRINKMSIKLGEFQIPQFLCRCNIRSHNDMFCHIIISYVHFVP
jgi:hypothetical protein